MDRDEAVRLAKEQALPTESAELQVQREIEALRSQHEAAVLQAAAIEDEILTLECQILRLQLKRAESELAALTQDAS